MKRNTKCMVALLLAFVMVASLAACQKNTVTPTTNPSATSTPAATATPAPTDAPMADWDGAYMERDDFKGYIKYDLEVLTNNMNAGLKDSQKTAVKAAYEEGCAKIDKCGTVAEIKAAYKDAFNAILAAVPTFDGLASYASVSNAEKTKILGTLETFGVATGITGISLFENGGYVMYNPRITLGTEKYIVGYGFGTLAEGAITADLESESNAAWKRYYHTFDAADPGTMNFLNAQGTDVSDNYSYIGASFYTNFMNATKDGYDWVPELAKTMPEAMNDDDGDGVASKWRFEVRTGADGLKYSTASTIPSRAAFNGREVALEDYEYAFKLLLTQANNLYRGSELAKSTTSPIVGASAYYDGSKDGFNAELWANVGIKTYVENGKNYFEVEFGKEFNAFYARYYISSSLYMPLPEEFINLVTVQNFAGFNLDATETPVDNTLSLGAYVLETYDADQQIVFKKNENYVYADTKYSIPGVHIKIYPAAAEDNTAGIKEFLLGHFDSSGIPQSYLDEYRNDPRTRTTTGDSNFKLNINATDKATWEALFGENGSVTQTDKDNYWDIKPALGNSHFVKALSYSIDRVKFATARGSIPSVDYFASNYMSDPENGIAYSSTDEHKKAVEILLDQTDGAGFSIELARDYFRLALTELEAEGAYKPGTKENPTVINLEIAWMYTQHEENYHNEIKNYLETAFNDESVTGGLYKLSVNFWVGNEWSDVYYNKMMVGQFDIGFGSITGNSLDPLGFMNVLSTDQVISGTFTLNWGVDTNNPDVYPLVYDGYRWAYDALYTSTQSKAIVANGVNKASYTVDYTEIKKNDDGTYTGSFDLQLTLADKSSVVVTDVMCCNYERYYNGDGQYEEAACTFTTEDKGNGKTVVTFTVPAEVVSAYATGTGYTGFDLYFNLTFDGTTSEEIKSVEDYFVVE